MSSVDLGRYSKKLMSLFWDPPPRNEETATIWCLGRSYDSKPAAPSDTPPQLPLSVSADSTASPASTDGPSRSTDSSDEGRRASHDVLASDSERGWPPAFLEDSESRIWLTYRSNFPIIPRSQDPNAASSMSLNMRWKMQFNSEGGFSSDTGWGCMIRSGQSLLANTLQILHLGRDWRRGKEPEEERVLLSWFADDPQAPFSIHKFVQHGATACGKHPGEWFGPSATAQCIQTLSEGYEKAGLAVYITGDGSDVYEDKFFKTARRDGGTCRPTLILVGIRLGIDRVTPVYWEALKTSLQLPQSIGIAGGRPSASHYFFGTQGPYFFYLDPHNTRPCLPYHSKAAAYSADDIDSCHTRRLRRLHVKEMDPSMLIGFLIRDEADWHEWRKSVTEVHGKPVIRVADTEPPLHGGRERDEAIDEVEAFDDDDEGLQ
ncbi:hypothetical protein K490DRAFT_42829 [Saccharata proteae CBS 121410]|uniref:Cysteine protease n=1 Tax=Saccharata proteae CBS 121410 TaxID=1314787 RepID=A0A9P4HVI7_9PEZI|nr:hypothetical protein K490DRAFT_42829 [Saccharata proteae CBS 121410]